MYLKLAISKQIDFLILTIMHVPWRGGGISILKGLRWDIVRKRLGNTPLNRIVYSKECNM